jgi:inhibitor of cysteine peptidase
MRRSRRFGVAAKWLMAMVAAPILLVVGCGDDADNDAAGPDVPAVTDRGAEFTVAVGERFEIVLESNATTGYAWLEPEPGGLVELVDDDYLPPDTDLVGAGGVQRLTFEAVTAGSGELYLWYVRSFDDPPEPADEARFPVEVSES